MSRPPRLVAPEPGTRFTRLTVTGPEQRVPHGSRPGPGDRVIPCRCDCGREVTVRLGKLLSGYTRSCDCLKRDKAQVTGKANLLAWSSSPEGQAQAAALGRDYAGQNRSHGLSKHPLYGVWWMMMARCHDPRHKRFHDYGGRGITVDERWHDVRNFIEDVERELGPRPAGCTPGGMPLYSIDRIDVNGDYGPGRVRWATWVEQQANSRRHHH